MKNWKKIAEAHDLRIPDADLDRIAPSLDALEAAFRPLAKTIPDDIEPAITFRLQPERGK
jgi:hypothetical protein